MLRNCNELLISIKIARLSQFKILTLYRFNIDVIIYKQSDNMYDIYLYYLKYILCIQQFEIF